jgi:hypothetical protein
LAPVALRLSKAHADLKVHMGRVRDATLCDFRWLIRALSLESHHLLRRR